jgi:hypothetical protein
MKQSTVSVAGMMLFILLLTFTPKAQAAAQITMVNKSQVKVNLYIDGNFACGPVLGIGQFTNSPGLSCTSGVMAGKHRLQARDGEKVIAEDVVEIGDGTSPTWTVGAEEAKAQATAQITMVNKSQATLTLYIDGNFGCGPVGPIGRFTNSPGLFCTSSITAGPHNLEARDGDKVVAHEDKINIGDGASPTWTVALQGPDELEATLQYIRDMIHSQGETNITYVVHPLAGNYLDSTIKNSVSTNVTEVSSQNCTLRYDRRARRVIDGKAQPASFDSYTLRLADVRNVTVVTERDAANERMLAASGGGAGISRVTPELYVVKVQADSAPDKKDPFFRFYFRNGTDAEHMQKAITHATELCGRQGK